MSSFASAAEVGDRVFVSDQMKIFPNTSCFQDLAKEVCKNCGWEWRVPDETGAQRLVGNVLASLSHPFRPMRQVAIVSLHSANALIAVDSAGVTRTVYREMPCIVSPNISDAALQQWHFTAFADTSLNVSYNIVSHREVPNGTPGRCAKVQPHSFYPMEFVWLVQLELSSFPPGTVVGCHAVELKRRETSKRAKAEKSYRSDN